MRNETKQRSMVSKEKNLKPEPSPKLSWKPGEYGASLEKVFDYVTGVAEKAAREAAERKQVGAIVVRVTNGDQLSDGWRLRVDGDPARVCRGTEAAVRNIAPEIHVVRVADKVQGVEKSVEKAVTVEAGEAATVSLTLQ